MGFRELVLFPLCSAVGLVCVCGWDERSQQETASVLASCPEKEKLFCKKKAREKRRKKAVVRLSRCFVKMGVASYGDAVL